jgi:multidrug efflux pump
MRVSRPSSASDRNLASGFAVMLGGWLGWWLPVSSLLQVDFLTIQVTTQPPGGSPDTIAALVPAPLERQFGQIPSLSVTSSSCSASAITCSSIWPRHHGAGRTQAASTPRARRRRGKPPSADPRQGEPGGCAGADAGAHSPTIRSATSATWPTPRWRSGWLRSAASAASRSRAESAPRCASRLICRGRRPASPEDIRQAIVGANVSGSKGSLDGAHQSYNLGQRSIDRPTYKALVVAYRNGAPVLRTDVAQVVDG